MQMCVFILLVPSFGRAPHGSPKSDRPNGVSRGGVLTGRDARRNVSSRAQRTRW